MRVWATYRTHDACNGCPNALLGLSASRELAVRLAEEQAAPYVPFGQPKWKRPPPLDWHPYIDDYDIEDAEALTARPPLSEDYIVKPEEVRTS